jgi:hypothetical protein
MMNLRLLHRKGRYIAQDDDEGQNHKSLHYHCRCMSFVTLSFCVREIMSVISKGFASEIGVFDSCFRLARPQAIRLSVCTCTVLVLHLYGRLLPERRFHD